MPQAIVTHTHSKASVPRLLKADAMRLIRHKSAWVAWILAFIFGISVPMFSYIIVIFVEKITTASGLMPNYLQVLGGVFSKSLLIYASVALSIFGVSDFQSRTVQNTLSVGYSRLQYIMAKFLTAGLFGISLMVLSFTTAILLALILFPLETDLSLWSHAFKPLLLSSLQAAALSTLFMTFAFVIRNTAITIITSLGVVLLLPILTSVLSMVLKFAKEIEINFSKFIPHHYITAMTPGDEGLGMMLSDGATTDPNFLWMGLLVGGITLALSFVLALLHFQRSDV